MNSLNKAFIIVIPLLLYSITSHTQAILTEKNFEQELLNYQPEQRVCDKDFAYAKMILRETKSATENNPANFNVADYFNILSAFLTLQESQENIDLAFQKFVSAEGSCEYLTSFKEKVAKTPKYDPIREAYMKELAKCQVHPDIHKTFDQEEYALEHGLDVSLVKAVYMIKLRDQEYRDGSGEWDPRQMPLDKDNQELINRLYADTKTYIGRSIVGQELETVMWSVIQHSNPEMMKKYLPVVHEAVENNELDVAPLKMLLDRYYSITEGYQLFGSQVGVDLVDEHKRMTVLEKFGLQ